MKARKNKGLGKEGKDLATVPATLFLVYTGVRTEEVREARWGEINREKKLWEVPREHRKNGRTKNEIRAIPISDEMFAVLDDQKRKTNALGDDDFIFPGGSNDGGLGKGTLLRLAKDIVKELGWDFKVTAHGFRSTLNTWAKAQDPPYHRTLSKLSSITSQKCLMTRGIGYAPQWLTSITATAISTRLLLDRGGGAT